MDGTDRRYGPPSVRAWVAWVGWGFSFGWVGWIDGGRMMMDGGGGWLGIEISEVCDNFLFIWLFTFATS